MTKKKEGDYTRDEFNRYGEYLKIGGSPIPGITLQQVLQGHTGQINRIAWSPNGLYLASSSDDKTIRIWDIARGECIAVLQNEEEVHFIAWSPNQELLASNSGSEPYGKGVLRIWNIKTRQVIFEEQQRFRALAWSPDGESLALASPSGQIQLLDTKKWKFVGFFEGHKDFVNDLVWSPDGNELASASGTWEENTRDKTIRMWDTMTRKQKRVLNGHFGGIYSIVWMPDHPLIISGSFDHSIRLWNTISGEQVQILEGHTRSLTSVTLSRNATLLASRSLDNNIFLWRTDTWDKVAEYREKATNKLIAGTAFNPRLNYLASLGNNETVIRIWGIDYDVLIANARTDDSIRYTTAKLVLVGDSGVGKSGLGWRLAHNEFKEHSSTHGQQFWIIPELSLKRKDGTECEAVLWDLAGQHVYRSIHSIFLDDVDAALVLFDPTDRQDTLKGVQFWLEQLKGKRKLPPSVLVGARLDRGAPVLSLQELAQFCQKYGIAGGYISTSAKTGDGLKTLLEILKEQIPWDQMTTTVTTLTFKRIKEFILSLKEMPDRRGVLVRLNKLSQQLQATDKDWQFTEAEMITAVGHLANHGYVTILKSSSGEEYVLLVPELLASVAASIFLHADKHPRDLGAINETELLQGKYYVEEFKGLEKEEQQVLLVAAVVRFLEHNICFREKLGNDNLLIFPSLIKQKRPLKDDIPSTDDMSYIVRGKVENIYAMLVVLLGYAPSFTRINQWQNQAQYETGKGNICGFRLIEDREGEIELVLYYGNTMLREERTDFQELFEHFLYQRNVAVISFPSVLCPKEHRQERATVVKRLREGKNFLYCEECGEKTNLSTTESRIIGIGASSWLQKEGATARLRSSYETYLARVKAYRQNWASPRCYLSCAPEHSEFSDRLKRDLKEANVYIVEEDSQVTTDDTVIVLDCPAYQKLWKARALGGDIGLVKSRLSTDKLISIVLEGNPVQVHNFGNCQLGDFCDETHYPISLFNLVLNLYVISLTHTGFVPLRDSLHRQWEQYLAQFSSKLDVGAKLSRPLKIFISYSHRDEEFKDELVTILAGLQRRGVIDAWQDRRIDAGDEWYNSIQEAMDECDLTLLLVSPDFIASRFIQEEELPRVLARREEAKLRVIPIIVRPCIWSSEPVLGDLQALPKDAKAVITFSKANGDRDQVWADIAKVIEKRAKK